MTDTPATSEIACPHCLYVSKRGVSVCRGCHAKVTYGMPQEHVAAWMVAVLLCAAVAYMATSSALIAVITLVLTGGAVMGLASRWQHEATFTCKGTAMRARESGRRD